MALCVHCIDSYGELGTALMETSFETKEEVAAHLENWHHGVVIKRPWETKEEAKNRCALKGIYPYNKRKCMCMECQDRRWLKRIKL